MKKTSALVLVLCMLLSLAACQPQQSHNSDISSTASTTTVGTVPSVETTFTTEQTSHVPNATNSTSPTTTGITTIPTTYRPTSTVTVPKMTLPTTTTTQAPTTIDPSFVNLPKGGIQIDIPGESYDSEYDLILGETLQLRATVGSSNTAETVTWSSADTSVVTVNQDGLVTSVGEGGAYIYATLPNGDHDTCMIRAHQPLSKIWFDTSDRGGYYSVSPGQKIYDIDLYYSPYDGFLMNKYEVIWTSSNPNIARRVVDESYGSRVIFEGLSPGTTTITANIEELGLSAQCSLVVDFVCAFGYQTTAQGNHFVARASFERYTDYSCKVTLYYNNSVIVASKDLVFEPTTGQRYFLGVQIHPTDISAEDTAFRKGEYKAVFEFKDNQGRTYIRERAYQLK